jgi:hypothetical protein
VMRRGWRKHYGKGLEVRRKLVQGGLVAAIKTTFSVFSEPPKPQHGEHGALQRPLC